MMSPNWIHGRLAPTGKLQVISAEAKLHNNTLFTIKVVLEDEIGARWDGSRAKFVQEMVPLVWPPHLDALYTFKLNRNYWENQYTIRNVSVDQALMEYQKLVPESVKVEHVLVSVRQPKDD